MKCLQCCYRLDDPDEFFAGRSFCRGCDVQFPRPRHGPLAPSACAASEPFIKRGDTVFSGDTRSGKGRESGTAEVLNQGHQAFVSEEARNIIAEGMQRFTANKVAPPQPDWIRLADNVVSVLGQNPGFGQLNGTNCYIVGTGKKRVLIDAGEHEAADKFVPVFKRVMEEIGCEGLQEILVTHIHHDHFGCIKHLQELYGPNIFVGKIPSSASAFYSFENLKSRDIIKYLEDENGVPRYTAVRDAEGEITGIPSDEELDWGGQGTEWDKHKRSKRQIVLQYPYMKATYEFEKRELGNLYPFHRLSEDDIIVTEGATLRVVRTPGHSEDHASFYLKEGNALFSGDHVLGFGTTFVQDMFDYVQSLRKMLALNPTTLFPGHGPCIDDGSDYLRRYISHRRARIDQVYSTLLQNGGTKAVMTAREIADTLYTKTPDALKQQAVQNCVQNLTFLVKEGRAHAYEYNADGALQVLDLSGIGFNGPPADTVFGLSRKNAKL